MFTPDRRFEPADQRQPQAQRRLREDPFDVVRRITREIGPRRAASLGEAKAAGYVGGRLRRAGMRVWIDPFVVPQPLAADGAVVAALALLGGLLSVWQPLPSLLLILWSWLFAMLPLLRGGAPVFARPGESQSIVATLAAREQPLRARLVLIAPLDSPAALNPAARLLMGEDARLRRIVLAGALLALSIARLFFATPALQIAALALLAWLVALAICEIVVLSRAASVGAVSHAGALATLLAAADTLEQARNVEVWAVAVGAGESGDGVVDLLRRYPFDPQSTSFVVLHGIGRGSLSLLVADGWPRAEAADAALLQQVQRAAADGRIALALGASRSRTLTAALRRAGLRAVTVCCLGRDGRVPLRATTGDTLDMVEPEVLEQGHQLLVALVRGMDR